MTNFALSALNILSRITVLLGFMRSVVIIIHKGVWIDGDSTTTMSEQRATVSFIGHNGNITFLIEKFVIIFSSVLDIVMTTLVVLLLMLTNTVKNKPIMMTKVVSQILQTVLLRLGLIATELVGGMVTTAT